MGARDDFTAEFDHEMAVTRRVLERIPEDAMSWKPHERSFSLGGLATHLARLPHWGRQILDQDAYDLATASGHGPDAGTLADVLNTFDGHVTDVRATLIRRTDVELQALWVLKRGTHTILSMPRLSALRRFLVHHVIHHRGQLTVYLRLHDVALPPVYGPTADERM